MGWMSDIWKTKSKDWTYTGIPPEKTPENLAHAPIAGNSGYLHVFLKSMRITDVRIGTRRFYGTVHSFITLPVLDGRKAEFQVVTTPGHLKDLDVAHVDRIVNLNQRLLGPVPYRGGDLEIEIGLLSIKSVDLAAPFLDVLESMSKAAGVSYLQAALPFVGPIKDGINLLAGAGGDMNLEIGLSQDFPSPETGYFVVMRAEHDRVNPAQFRIDNKFQLVDDANGQAIGNYPYLIFSVSVTPKRDDWFLIPDLAATHKDLRETIKSGQQTRVDEGFTVFKRAVLTSPDLLLQDAQRLVNQVEGEVKAVVSMAPTAAGLHPTISELKDVNLY